MHSPEDPGCRPALHLPPPAGPAGIVLPGAIVLLMLANLDAAFSVPVRPGAAAAQGSQAAVAAVMEKLRLVLEWAMVPLLVIGLQLPHGEEREEREEMKGVAVCLCRAGPIWSPE